VAAVLVTGPTVTQNSPFLPQWWPRPSSLYYDETFLTVVFCWLFVFMLQIIIYMLNISFCYHIGWRHWTLVAERQFIMTKLAVSVMSPTVWTCFVRETSSETVSCLVKLFLFATNYHNRLWHVLCNLPILSTECLCFPCSQAFNCCFSQYKPFVNTLVWFRVWLL